METEHLPDERIGQQQVERVLDGFFTAAKERAERISPSYLSLWETLEKSTVGGKRLRPQIVMTAYTHLGGTDLEAAARVGAAFELLHTALIVHDDVIDLDFVRRGQDNVCRGLPPDGRNRWVNRRSRPAPRPVRRHHRRRPRPDRRLPDAGFGLHRSADPRAPRRDPR